MNEKEKHQHGEIEIDIVRVIRAIKDRAWLLALVSVLCAAIAFGCTLCFITPQYQSSVMFYVNNSADSSTPINSGDLATSRSLVDSYLVILSTRETLNAVIDYADVELSYDELSDMISASAVNGTEVIQVTVTNPDPQRAATLANAVAEILPQQISDIIDGTSAKIVDYATVPSDPSSPNYLKSIVIGFLAGFLACAGILILNDIFDTRIRSEEDIEQVCTYPILTQVPDMQSGGTKSPYAHGAEKKQRRNKKKKHAAAVAVKTRNQNELLIGSKVSFIAAEAYKRLRTKLQFSFSDDRTNHVIGLSSSLSGEGKSLTAINLAYTLAQLNKRVIIIDCDMRRPTLAEKTGLQKKPGLSEYLTGQHEFMDVVQCYGRKKEDVIFHVITAGENPPNPVEMLSSLRMERLLSSLREAYDYVLLDLPPVAEVTDAMAVAPKTDGMLLVVRQNYCNRIVLSETVRQFEYMNAKILGIVFNCTVGHLGIYSGKGYGYYTDKQNR